MKKIVSIILAAIMVMGIFTGCSGEKEPTMDYDILTITANFVRDMEMDLKEGGDEYFEFLEIAPEWYEEGCVYYAPVSSSVELVVGVKAKDKDSAKNILDTLDKRKTEMAAAQENYNKVLAEKAMAGTAVVKEDVYILFAIAGEDADYKFVGGEEAMKPVVSEMENVFEAQRIGEEYKARRISGEEPDVDNQI